MSIQNFTGTDANGRKYAIFKITDRISTTNLSDSHRRSGEGLASWKLSDGRALNRNKDDTFSPFDQPDVQITLDT